MQMCSPHPVYSAAICTQTKQVNGRAASTAILYLLPAGAKSKLHRLDASECWHAYLGTMGWLERTRRAMRNSGSVFLDRYCQPGRFGDMHGTSACMCSHVEHTP